MTTRLTVVIAALSILVAITGNVYPGGLLGHLIFRPSSVLAGELWQVVTYALVVPLPSGGAIFSFLISLWFLYSIGSQVEAVLGPRRFLGFYLGASALGALATIPFAYLFGFASAPYTGLWVALGALTILFAHHFARQPVYLMFVLPVQGRQLTLVAFGILALFAIVDGPARMLPAFFSMVAALAFANGLFRPRRAWLRFRAWRIERELKRRTRRFSVIEGEKKGDDRTNVARPKRSDDGSGPWLH
ncbi:Integral membrane protein [Vulgatibacter incomptus]|uniref:Integral membrane protein n=2 Tax=Vulgatibacter incomptus TaxID=1391653 RepID=A0A0K1PED4_9BACT|nr:Integral membrane protein [Vulgatibacter incomptus]